MIEIQDLDEVSLDDVLSVLKEEGEQSFEIYIPKNTQQFYSTNEAIAEDYAYLAYCGQLLHSVSTEFDYEQVSPAIHESVCFTIKAGNLQRLAETLLFISYGYNNEHPENPEFPFIDYVYEYRDKVAKREIKDVACPYFLEIAAEFESEIAEDDERDDH